jgi:hypothetical protein
VTLTSYSILPFGVFMNNQQANKVFCGLLSLPSLLAQQFNSKLKDGVYTSFQDLKRCKVE